MTLKGHNKNILIELNFGINKNYENFVEIYTHNNKKIRFSPFFYGRKVQKSIVEYNDVER